MRPKQGNCQAAAWVAASIALVATPAWATNHLVQIDEAMAQCAGNAGIQFFEMKFPPGQNQWANCVRIDFFDAAGNSTGSFPVTSSPLDQGQSLNSGLFATSAFASLPNAPTPDFIIPADLMAPSGKVCF